MSNTDFDDLEDPAFRTGGIPADERQTIVAKAVEDAATLGNWEACRKCSGSGQTRWGVCFACKGKGGQHFKTPRAERLADKANREQREARKRHDAVEAFKVAHHAEWQWITDGLRNDFAFAISLHEGIQKFGDLTERQMEAVRRNIAKRADQKASAQHREATAPEISVGRIEEAFASASAHGLKNPKLRLGTFTFSPAKAHGKNPGAIYVKDGDEYLGKVVAGKFVCVGSCGDHRRDEVVAAAADPEAAAVAHGKLTGSCSCCGRELTDPQSVARGIGPICADKYGW